MQPYMNNSNSYSCLSLRIAMKWLICSNLRAAAQAIESITINTLVTIQLNGNFTIKTPSNMTPETKSINFRK